MHYGELWQRRWAVKPESVLLSELRRREETEIISSVVSVAVVRGLWVKPCASVIWLKFGCVLFRVWFFFEGNKVEVGGWRLSWVFFRLFLVERRHAPRMHRNERWKLTAATLGFCVEGWGGSRVFCMFWTLIVGRGLWAKCLAQYWLVNNVGPYWIKELSRVISPTRKWNGSASGSPWPDQEGFV